MTNEMYLNMTSNICEHEQSVQGTWPESYMKRRVSNMISELDKLIKKILRVSLLPGAQWGVEPPRVWTRRGGLGTQQPLKGGDLRRGFYKSRKKKRNTELFLCKK